MNNNFLLSQLYAFITVVFWASSYTFTFLALQAFSVGALGFVRNSVACLCLGAFVLIRRYKLPRLADVPWFILAGAAGFALYLLAFNKGSGMLNPTTACIIIATSPVITAFLARWLVGEKLTALHWIAILLAFCGILLMTLWDGVLAITSGTFWMLIAAFLISLYNILQRKLIRKYSAPEITAYSFLAAALLLLPFLPETASQARAATTLQVGLAVFLGIGPSAAAYLFWAKAMALAPKTTHVSNYMFLTPFLALLLEYAVFGVWPGAGTFAGGGLILFALLLFTLAGQKRLAK